VPHPHAGQHVGVGVEGYDDGGVAEELLDTNNDGSYQHSFNEDLIELGLARTTDFSHEHRREYERLREEAEERGAGLWGACPDIEP
jgi:hypothetical protein